MRRRRLFPSAALAAVAALICAVPAGASTPFASGDSAANIPIDSANTQALLRWVPDRNGTVRNMYIHVKVEGSAACPLGGRNGYASGTTGILQATTYKILPDGRPDTSAVVSQYQVNPCQAQTSETVAIPLNLAVLAGQEYGTVISNADSSPSQNYFSYNTLYIGAGIPGANGRNERNYAATDAYMGLDPRELVGYSTDGGRSWRLPGGPYGARSGGSFIPTYGLVYADGSTGGQPYYYAGGGGVGSEGAAMRVTAKDDWTVTGLGAYGSGTGTLTLEIGGQQVASAAVSGSSVMVGAITPIRVARGTVMTVRATGGLSLRRMFADNYWDELMGHGTNYWYSSLSGGADTPVSIFPVYLGPGLAPPAEPPPATAPLPTLAAPPTPPVGRRATPAPKSPSRRVIVVGKGVARVKLTCGARRGCKARLLITSPAGRQVFANRKLWVLPGKRTIGLRLTPSTIRRLVKKGRVNADLRALGAGSWRQPVVLVLKKGPRR
jgi:hypothetical protein